MMTGVIVSKLPDKRRPESTTTCWLVFSARFCSSDFLLRRWGGDRGGWPRKRTHEAARPGRRTCAAAFFAAASARKPTPHPKLASEATSRSAATPSEGWGYIVPGRVMIAGKNIAENNDRRGDRTFSSDAERRLAAGFADRRSGMSVDRPLVLRPAAANGRSPE